MREILNFLKKITEPPRAFYQVSPSFFKIDKKKELFLKKNGYLVIDFLDETEISLLNEKLTEFLNENPALSKELFYTSGRDTEYHRERALRLTWPIIKKKIGTVIQEEHCEAYGGSFMLKPTGEKSLLAPHQDSSLTDETKFAAFYGWIPLQDVSVLNGCMHIIPGSHLWGNHYRSLDVPWLFEAYTDLLYQFIVPVEMKKGQLLIFDSALVHGSYPNLSDKIRISLNLFMKNKQTDVLHFFSDSQTPKHKIECYKVSFDYFAQNDYRQRPDTNKFPFVGYVNKIKITLSKKKIYKLYNLYK